MSTRSKLFATIAALPLAGAALLAVSAPASATAPPAPNCVVGYVCVQFTNGAVEAIPGGATRTYNPAATMVGITNGSAYDYCVDGSPDFQLKSGWYRDEVQPITRIAPGEVCTS
ncbi:hypothetical protein DP939_04895 [Spongiactinospora rosea]|uniref:Peptidase inhibitor family I36 n=1 Tax=Spongiactinospora rosea TaxID=2248750 RepID=A0A366M763_9ACTN|nr:hypothetical protein [Spongiactinospora rosea]RBQ22005.1 hypothetical protein DP939_04895 [Spongiactinospora rosea]